MSRTTLARGRRLGAPGVPGAPGTPGGWSVGKVAAVPELDQPAGDRGRRRQAEFPRVDARPQLSAAEPARLADLLLVDHDPLPSRGDRLEPEHQAARHRP